MRIGDKNLVAFFFSYLSIMSMLRQCHCVTHFVTYRYENREKISRHLFRIVTTLRELSFFTRRGGRLSVMAGRQFFLVPPLPTAKNFGPPPLGPTEKILVPPLDYPKKFWSPHKQTAPPPGNK